MIPLLTHDMSVRPDLFQMDGGVDKQALDSWAMQRKLDLPRELLDVWQEVGGGELFETETILCPLAPAQLGDDLDSVNGYHRRRGMPERYVVFHVGMGGLSAYDQRGRSFCQLDDGAQYRTTARFVSLSTWYSGVLRQEYATRYGLD